jgi:hypothetical protein
MSSTNLAVVMGPNILRPALESSKPDLAAEDSSAVVATVAFLIDHADVLGAVPDGIIDSIRNVRAIPVASWKTADVNDLVSPW